LASSLKNTGCAFCINKIWVKIDKSFTKIKLHQFLCFQRVHLKWKD
jgi:hypothetical protein